jgi:hypothetical protein
MCNSKKTRAGHNELKTEKPEISETETELTETELFRSLFGLRFLITEISWVYSVIGLG